jgi:hypothetical protein
VVAGDLKIKIKQVIESDNGVLGILLRKICSRFFFCCFIFGGFLFMKVRTLGELL